MIKNYQAQGNVIVLGRIHGTDTNDHGDLMVSGGEH